MDNPFSQPKLIYKLKFNTFYKYLEPFETFLPEDNLGISSFETESKTIDAQDNDIWCIETYFATEPNSQQLKKNLQNFAKNNNLEILGKINFSILEDKDWVTEYQKQLAPINVGKFFITTLKHSSNCPENHIPIILEASRAFGSGDHDTTSGCLEAMQELAGCKFATVFDIGTGSGILSFASAKLWPEADVLACDVDKVSIEVAKFNQKFNKTNVFFYQNLPEDLSIPSKYARSFDLILSNILAKPLISLAPTICQLLNKRGKLILSGFLDYQKDEVIEAYKKFGLYVDKVLMRGEWVILVMERN